MGKYRFTPEAEADLNGIWEYIAEDNPVAAFAVIDRIEEKCGLLSDQPRMGQRCENLAPALRSFPVGNYMIFYRKATNGIDIIRVLHGARDIESLFTEDE